MTDRELLELAAKAAGLSKADREWPNRWEPLTDDGQEARLEAALCLSVEWGGDFKSPFVTVGGCLERFHEPDDRQAARRRAGVRAAAELGRAMP